MINSIKNNTFQITYPTGSMELYLDAFFPCTVARGKKVFRLIRANCTQEQQDNLLAYLTGRAKAYQDRAVELDKEMETCHADRPGYERAFAELRDVCRKHSQIARNIRDFVRGC